MLDYGIGLAVIGGIVLVVVIFILISVFVGRYIKVGPDEALIVSGRKKKLSNGQVVGFRIIAIASFIIPTAFFIISNSSSIKGLSSCIYPVLSSSCSISDIPLNTIIIPS